MNWGLRAYLPKSNSGVILCWYFFGVVENSALSANSAKKCHLCPQTILSDAIALLDAVLPLARHNNMERLKK